MIIKGIYWHKTAHSESQLKGRFSYPGIGLLLYRGVTRGDYNLVMGITVLSILTITTAVLILDLFYPLFDPRIRHK